MFSRDDVIGTREFTLCDLLDDGINGEQELFDADGNSVGTVDVSIEFEEGEGKQQRSTLSRRFPSPPALFFLFFAANSSSWTSLVH